jgi:hypothetical protein
MTEVEWLGEQRHPHPLLTFLQEQGLTRTKAGKRRFRLFACACCRHIWSVYDESSRRLVEAGERIADGLLDRQEHARVEKEAKARYKATVNSAPRSGMPQLAWDLQSVCCAVQANSPTEQAWGAVFFVAETAGFYELGLEKEKQEQPRHVRFDTAEKAEYRAQCELVRDIFGNPFRPLPRRSFSAHIQGLAQAWYEGDASVLPLLADALADHGEQDAADHLRQGSHVKGCHVAAWARGLV